jgi:hypothetical protein
MSPKGGMPSAERYKGKGRGACLHGHHVEQFAGDML